MFYFRNKYFGVFIQNPIKTWWKARKYFKFPKVSFNLVWRWLPRSIEKDFAEQLKIKTYKIFGKRFYFSNELLHCPYASLNYIGKIIDIDIHDVSWKDKWDFPRHEDNPFIYVCLFGSIGFRVTFYQSYIDPDCTQRNCSMEYWEYMLDYLYYNKSLKKSLSQWVYDSKLWEEVNYKTEEHKPFVLVVPVTIFSLNKRGKKELRKIILNNKEEEEKWNKN